MIEKLKKNNSGNRVLLILNNTLYISKVSHESPRVYKNYTA